MDKNKRKILTLGGTAGLSESITVAVQSFEETKIDSGVTFVPTKITIEERDEHRKQIRSIHKAMTMGLYGNVKVITARTSGKASALSELEYEKIPQVDKGKIPCTCYKNSKKRPCLVHGRR